MKIALLGANGQLGRDLQQVLSDHIVVPFTRDDFDVLDHVGTRAAISEARPTVILNTTAYHRVDDCESNVEMAYQANALAVLNLVRIANDLEAVLVHISTDYVFDGKSLVPYTEESQPMPLSVYGNSKLAGEYLVRSGARKYFLIRTSGLYGNAGSRGRGGNFVETMLAKARNREGIQVVNDQVLTPTYTVDVAHQIAAILATAHYGLFHMTNEGSCSWYEFALRIFQLAGVDADVTPTTSDLYKTPAIRPRYSVLENARLKSLGLNRMRNWREALAAYFHGKSAVGLG
ncbi:MAG: dTDP-4-dehydrorhamnose reductase [Acidobacteria bacterium]|nr:MAG: dTDP-4-dehydrorhamnose reductase [Acidobacteriota bacterium]